MRLFFDLGLGKFVERPGYSGLLSSVSHKRGDGGKIEVLFSREGVAAAIGTPTEMVYAVKVDFEEETDPLILANTADWSFADGVWSALISSDGGAILTALNGAASGVFKGEFTFRDENGGPTSSQTLNVSIFNDVWKGTEGTPLTLPTPDEYVAARAVLFDRAQSLTGPQKIQALNNLGLPSLNNWAGGRAPLVTDDTASGYVVGSLWIDDSATPKEAYRAFSVGAGAADWQLTTLTADELGSAAFAETEDFETAGAAAALLASNNSWSGNQAFGSGFQLSSQSLYSVTASFLYFGPAAAAHRTALGLGTAATASSSAFDPAGAAAAAVPIYLLPNPLTSSGAIAWNIASGVSANLTLAHNTTITLSNLADGQTASLSGIMGGAGGYTLALAHAGLTLRAMGEPLTAIAALTTAAPGVFELSVKRNGSVLRHFLTTRNS